MEGDSDLIVAAKPEEPLPESTDAPKKTRKPRTKNPNPRPKRATPGRSKYGKVVAYAHVESRAEGELASLSSGQEMQRVCSRIIKTGEPGTISVIRTPANGTLIHLDGFKDVQLLDKCVFAYLYDAVVAFKSAPDEEESAPKKRAREEEDAAASDSSSESE